MEDLDQLLVDRLVAHPVEDRVADLVLAAVLGDDELTAALGGDPPARPEPSGDQGPVGPPPAGAFLRSISVSGFRGVGPAATLELEPGPGLTVVCGRNGSGKSSFAEAVEVLFTGNIRRLEERSAVWRDSWRCLHETKASVHADLVVEGTRGGVTVSRRWAPSDVPVTAGETVVSVPGEAPGGMDRLGWGSALSLYRPFLSHAELEVLLARPADLHDQLNALLDLDGVADVATRLAGARKAASAVVTAANEALRTLRNEAHEVSDERAEEARRLLAGRVPDVDALEGLATGQSGQLDGAGIDRLSRLAALGVPEATEISAVAGQLSEAASRLETAADAAVTDASATADLLAAALDHFDRHGPGPCPVCGGSDALDPGWQRATKATVEGLRTTAAAHRVARADAAVAESAAARLLSPVPDPVADSTDIGIELGALRDAWTAWADHRPDASNAAGLRATAEHLTSTYPALAETVASVNRAAAAELSRRRDLWAPLAASIAAWTLLQRKALDAGADAKALKAAEAWLRRANDDLRNDRLRPFADGTAALWEKLRQGSNVDLVGMTLTGAATRRAVDFDVTVDGRPAPGLGVMSQGEINALALSVFLPRATAGDSPLRFVIIDDPVQAMDPSKVDGIAAVFAEAARTRQVIVFTHDERLPAALRHLNLPARVVQVTRHPGSLVELSAGGDPAGQYIRDAEGLVASDDVPAAVAGRVVPGLCRSAIEAACIDLTRRRRLRRGDSHESIEDAFASANRLVAKLALAIHDDSERGGDVYSWMTKNVGATAVGTIKTCNAGTHAGSLGDARILVSETRRVVEQLNRRLR